MVSLKVEDDVQLRDKLISQFERIDKTGRGVVNENQVKKALHNILRKQIKKLTMMSSDDDGSESDSVLIGGMAAYTDGAYAKDTID